MLCSTRCLLVLRLSLHLHFLRPRAITWTLRAFPSINTPAAPALQSFTSPTTNTQLNNLPHRLAMARYTIKVASGGQTASLLVVLSPDQLCSALVDAIRKRLPTIASKLNLATTNNLHINLHLDKEDGPMLDAEDLLSNVLPGADETVFAVIEVSIIASTHDVALHVTRLTSLCSRPRLSPQPLLPTIRMLSRLLNLTNSFSSAS